MLIPPIRLRDNLQLGTNEYRFLIKGNPIAQGQLMPGQWLAMNATNSRVTLKGIPTVEPVFQLPATWVTDVERKNAETGGYTVVDAASVLVTHLAETVRRRCHEILTRQDVQTLLDNLKKTHPAVVNELVPGQLSIGLIQRILQNLLAEGISIRNLAGILEKVGDCAAFTKNPDELSEYARRALGPQIVKPFQTDNGSYAPSRWIQNWSINWRKACGRRPARRRSSWSRGWRVTSWIHSQNLCSRCCPADSSL